MASNYSKINKPKIEHHPLSGLNKVAFYNIIDIKSSKDAKKASNTGIYEKELVELGTVYLLGIQNHATLQQ